MKVVLIEPKSQGYHVFSGIILPRLGLPLLGSILKSLGHKVKIFCEEIRAINWSEIKAADVVGISTITSTAPRAYEIADRIKAFGKSVVMGGPHVTFRGEEALKHADFVVKGEGEESFPKVLEAIEGRKSPEKIRGISFKVKDKVIETENPPLICNLDDLPDPDLTLIEGHERMRVTPVLTSRGCPYDCTFCSVTRIFGRGYRTRSVEKVLDELERLKPRTAFFYDDNFTHNRKRVYEICKGIIERGLKFIWSAQSRVDIAQDFKLLKIIRKSGCSLLHIGFESVNPETLKLYKKGINPASYMRSIKEFKKAGIDIHGMFVLGSDADTAESIEETVKFAKRARLFSVQFLALTPLPGTPLFEGLKRKQRIFTTRWDLYDGHHVVFMPEKMSVLDLQGEIVKATFKFYSSVQFLRNLVTLRWVRAYYLASGRKKIKGWVKQNAEFLNSLRGQVLNHEKFMILGLTPEGMKNSQFKT